MLNFVFLHAQTGRGVIGRDFFQRDRLIALVLREFAARHERTTAGSVSRQIGRHAGNGVKRRAFGLQRGNGFLQRARVGMRGAREKFVGRGALSTMRPAYMTCTRSAETRDDAEIVRDPDHRHAEFALHFFDEIENLRLHGDIERGGRFVGNQQFRLA